MRLFTRLCFAAALAFIPISVLAQESGIPATETAAARATVLDFQGEAQLNELAAVGKTVVFFYAAWCPNCRATVAELNERFDEVDPDLTLVIADYDREGALKGKFGVTYQDTFVLLDEVGNAVKSWNSGGVDGLNANSQS